MTKLRTNNLGLILLDDQNEGSFYADLVENLVKIDDETAALDAGLGAKRQRFGTIAPPSRLATR